MALRGGEEAVSADDVRAAMRVLARHSFSGVPLEDLEGFVLAATRAAREIRTEAAEKRGRRAGYTPAPGDTVRISAGVPVQYIPFYVDEMREHLGLIG